MATRKPIVLVSGLFEEVNTPTDKLDFAGNTTTDLAEGTNLYYTNTRSRQAISSVDSGGDGSLSYDNTTGVITYTGPSASEVRAHFLAANSGTGFGSLSYNSANGTFTYSVVTASNIRQQISVVDSGGDGSLSYDNTTGVITYNGPTGTDVRSYFSVAVGSGLTYNSTTGQFGTSAIPNTQLANSSITFGSTAVSLGSTVSALSLTSVTASSYVNVGGGTGSAGSLNLEPGAIVFEGATADAFETTLQVVNPTADQTITFPNASGTVALLSSLSVAAGSGLTYNNTTGQFGTSNIPNAQLANSSITIGSTGIALGSSSTTLTGLTSVTSTGITTNDSGFRIRNTTDITKQIAFDASVIGTGTTRTLTVPNSDGTLVLAGLANAFTGANSFTNAAGQVFRVASGQDGIQIVGRAGGSSGYVVEMRTAALSGNQTITFPDQTGTVALLGTANAFTGANTFTNATGQTFRQAATQDGFIVQGRAGGTSSYAITLTTATLSSSRTITFPDLDGTVLLDSSSLSFTDNTFRIKDNVDNTKQLAFECSGISAATTRTMTVPNENGTISTQEFATAVAIALG